MKKTKVGSKIYPIIGKDKCPKCGRLAKAHKLSNGTTDYHHGYRIVTILGMAVRDIVDSCFVKKADNHELR